MSLGRSGCRSHEGVTLRDHWPRVRALLDESGLQGCEVAAESLPTSLRSRPADARARPPGLVPSGRDMATRAVRSRGAVEPTRQLATRPPLRRLMWAIARLRSGRPIKATDVAAEFEVNVRTAYRDLDFLRDEWRVPLEFDRAKGSYLLTEPMTALPPVTLSQGELVVALLRREGARAVPGHALRARPRERLPQDAGAAAAGSAHLAGHARRLPVASTPARCTRPTPRSSGPCWAPDA